MTNFLALELSYEFLDAVQPSIQRLKSTCGHLGDQLERAATRVTLSLAESRGRRGADRRKYFRYADGSLEESRGALRSGVCLRHLGADDVAEALRIGDRLGRMLGGLLR